MGDDLYVNTEALMNASGDLSDIGRALAGVSEMAKSALTNLAEYDSPKFSSEIKTALRNWIATVGDPDIPPTADGATMLSRLKDFATFLESVAGAYTA